MSSLKSLQKVFLNDNKFKSWEWWVKKMSPYYIIKYPSTSHAKIKQNFAQKGKINQ